MAHTILFSRHHLLDCAFRIFAVLGLLALAAVTQTRILIYVAIPMLIGISAAYKLNRISRDLKHRALPKASADDQTIPSETAMFDVAMFDVQFSKPVTSKGSTCH